MTFSPLTLLLPQLPFPFCFNVLKALVFEKVIIKLIIIITIIMVIIVNIQYVIIQLK